MSVAAVVCELTPLHLGPWQVPLDKKSSCSLFHRKRSEGTPCSPTSTGNGPRGTLKPSRIFKDYLKISEQKQEGGEGAFEYVFVLLESFQDC